MGRHEARGHSRGNDHAVAADQPVVSGHGRQAAGAIVAVLEDDARGGFHLARQHLVEVVAVEQRDAVLSGDSRVATLTRIDRHEAVITQGGQHLRRAHKRVALGDVRGWSLREDRRGEFTEAGVV